ncbi:MAG: hypothetical protein HZC40_09345 [Chloroflexi bacterium]|nr:hypothetical protein [Chloroflexota bacterium]
MNKNWLIICALMFIAFALRVFQLDAVALRGDESFTVIFVQRTWDGLWRGIRFIEPNPPLYYLALRAWVALAGASEFATRYFSVWFGVLCVPLMYRLANVIASRGAARNDTGALIAAALIAINPYQIWHSQDVRNYTLWPALSLLTLIFFWRWWRLEIGDWRFSNIQYPTSNFQSLIPNLAFYILATTAALYTHYYDTFILVAENLFVVAFVLLARRWRTLARWIGAQIVLVLVYAPWVLFGTNRISTYGEGSAEQSVALLDQFSRTLATFVVGDTVPAELKTLLWLPLALALGAILIWRARSDRARAAFLFLWIAAPTLALYAISIGRPLFLERYLNGIAPAYYLVFALGIVTLIKPDYVSRFTFSIVLLFFIAASTFSLANYFFNPAYAKSPDWRALMHLIAKQSQPGDIVIQNFTEMSALYYRPPELPVLTLPKDFQPTPEDDAALQKLMREYRRIWFIPAQTDWWDPDHVIENRLTRSADRVFETRVSVFRPQLYLTPREFEAKIIPLNARVGDATLVGYRVEGTRDVRVVLYWRAAQKIEKDFTVFVHIADANERVIAQHDGAPARGTYPTRAWQIGELIVDGRDLIVDTSGTFSIFVGMYDPATLARVSVFDATGARLPNDRVMLTQITIPQ